MRTRGRRDWLAAILTSARLAPLLEAFCGDSPCLASAQFFIKPPSLKPPSVKPCTVKPCTVKPPLAPQRAEAAESAAGAAEAEAEAEEAEEAEASAEAEASVVGWHQDGAQDSIIEWIDSVHAPSPWASSTLSLAPSLTIIEWIDSVCAADDIPSPTLSNSLQPSPTVSNHLQPSPTLSTLYPPGTRG